jgi:hypothetical protein
MESLFGNGGLRPRPSNVQYLVHCPAGDGKGEESEQELRRPSGPRERKQPQHRQCLAEIFTAIELSCTKAHMHSKHLRFNSPNDTDHQVDLHAHAWKSDHDESTGNFSLGRHMHAQSSSSDSSVNIQLIYWHCIYTQPVDLQRRQRRTVGPYIEVKSIDRSLHK